MLFITRHYYCQCALFHLFSAHSNQITIIMTNMNPDTAICKEVAEND